MAKVKLSASDFGMIEVSEAAFFATIGQLNVHPTIGRERYDPELGYLSRWKTPDGRTLGGSVGGTYLSHRLFMVTEDFFEKNRDAIAAAAKSVPQQEQAQSNLFGL